VLDCGHDFCKGCLYDHLKSVTHSRMIITASEGEFNFTCLDPGCRAPIDMETVRDLLGRKMWAKYKREADDRGAMLSSKRCCNCMEERNPNEFINQHVDIQCRSHTPICVFCVRITGCPKCNRAYNREEIEGIMKQGLIKKCYKPTCQSNDLSEIDCESHPRL
jgi:hypothetical protein